MFEPIEPLDVYNKNINILIGAGASADLLPTLALAAQDANGRRETIETLASKYENFPELRTALFMHYYNTCIFPAQTFDPILAKGCCVITGTAFDLPMILKIDALLKEHRPNSDDVDLLDLWA